MAWVAVHDASTRYQEPRLAAMAKCRHGIALLTDDPALGWEVVSKTAQAHGAEARVVSFPEAGQPADPGTELVEAMRAQLERPIWIVLQLPIGLKVEWEPLHSLLDDNKVLRLGGGSACDFIPLQDHTRVVVIAQPQALCDCSPATISRLGMVFLPTLPPQEASEDLGAAFDAVMADVHAKLDRLQRLLLGGCGATAEEVYHAEHDLQKALPALRNIGDRVQALTSTAMACADAYRVSPAAPVTPDPDGPSPLPPPQDGTTALEKDAVTVKLKGPDGAMQRWRQPALRFTYQGLLEDVASRVPQAASHRLSYRDEDGDQVTLGSQADFDEMVEAGGAKFFLTLG